MSFLLQKLLEMTLYGSIAVIVVLLFRVIFRRFPKKMTVLFWLIVAIRFMCPINFESDLSLMNLIDHREKAGTGSVMILHEVGIQDTAPGASDNSKAEAFKRDSRVSSFSDAGRTTNKAPDRDLILTLIWGSGTILLLTYAAVRYVKVSRFISRCSKTRDDQILLSDEVESPLTAGFLHPSICLPFHIEESEKKYLLIHEKIHIKNHDSITKTIGFLIACVHWFNPLAWISYILLCSDLEMRCDEEVIETLGKGIKKDYCRSLVMHSVKDPISAFGNTAFRGLGLGAMEVKMRIDNLLHYKKISKALTVLILCFTFGTISVLTACASKDEPGSDAAPKASTAETSNVAAPSGDETQESTAKTRPAYRIEDIMGDVSERKVSLIISSSGLEVYDYSGDSCADLVNSMIDSGYEYLGAEFPDEDASVTIYLEKDGALKLLIPSNEKMTADQIYDAAENLLHQGCPPLDLEIEEGSDGAYGKVTTADGKTVMELESHDGARITTWFFEGQKDDLIKEFTDVEGFLLDDEYLWDIPLGKENPGDTVEIKESKSFQKAY